MLFMRYCQTLLLLSYVGKDNEGMELIVDDKDTVRLYLDTFMHARTRTQFVTY